MDSKFENMSKDEMQKMMSTMMDKFFNGMPDEEKMRMKNMCSSMCGSMCGSMFANGGDMQSMFAGMMGQEKAKEANKEGIPSEVQSLFEEWKSQIFEEIEKYKSQNKTASNKEIADFLKLSETSINYFLKSPTEKSVSKTPDSNFEIIKVEKTNNSCSLCENYVKANLQKPIVVMSCEGACLRGEIARKTANILCHSLAPEKTVRLCLGSALTKDAGQRRLVKNAQKILALEGCSMDCGSRLLKGIEKGIEKDINLEVIRTDTLANFNKDLFGIDELSEEDTDKCALEVAEKLVSKL